ncbi:MAG: extracellular solute-binding protein [Cellulomonadaceae bacterium]|jgi:multiple sugar transport system substrate-binding protein|nr:extracellular solute-binding protein [Cellulomonadaceae bacterium]
MIGRTARRAVFGIAAFALVLSTASGCGRDAATEEAPVQAGTVATEATGELEVWAMGAEGDMLDAFLDSYREKNPNVTVKVVSVPWTAAADRFQTAIAGNTTPDVAMMGTTWMSMYGHAFAPVPDAIDTSDFFEGAVATTKINDQAVGVPWYVDTRVMYYRSDIADQAGWTEPPTTWDDFTTFLTDIKDKTDVDYPIRMLASGQDAFQNSLWAAWSAGAQLTDEGETAWTIDSPEMVKALEFYTGIFTNGLADTAADATPGATESEFTEGRIAAFIEGPWMRGVLTGLAGDDFANQFSTAPLPAPEGGTSTSFAGGSNLVVFENSDNIDSAWNLVQWMTSPETQVEFFKATGNLPPAQSAWGNEALQGDAKLEAFSTQLEHTMSPPVATTWMEVAAKGDQIMEQMIVANKPVAEGVTELQTYAANKGMGE